MRDKILDAFFVANKITPSQPFYHRCTESCVLWRQPKTDNYVCMSTYSVHVCGQFCDRGIASKGNEGLVCPLTGIVVGEIYPIIMRPGSMGGPGEINCVSSTLVRRSIHVSTRKDDTSINRYINSALALIYKSSSRTDLQAKKQERICRFIKKELRRGADFSEINAQLFGKDIAYSYNYNTTHEFYSMLKKVSSRILSHWKKFELRGLKKIIYAFVAAITTLLSTGKIVDGITLYPKLSVLKMAQPDEADLGPLLNISCRNITKMIKHILSVSIHEDGLPKVDFIFDMKDTHLRRQTLVAKKRAKLEH